MGLIFKQFLDSNDAGAPRVFACLCCKTHLATNDQIISKEFRGQHGQAILFDTVVNIFEGSPENRRMTTGLHIVRDIFCTYCQTVVGWKYDKAFEKSQEYKEGHYILERELIYEV
eukprot:jgi/Hompol1/5882/HPOL_000181-RA